MSKVVLFSTRTIGEENTLFGAGCKREILNQDDSPIFKYFIGSGASDEEHKELGKNFPPSSCFDEIIKCCSQKGVWKDDYEKMLEEDVLADLSRNEELKNDEDFKSLFNNYYTHDTSGGQAAIVFNACSFKQYLSNDYNKNPIRLALNIDNPNTDVAIDERFSIYVKSQSGEETEFVFMSIWPLGRTERKEENGCNIWISTLVRHICKNIKNCDEIILLLHDKDISDSQPFKIITSQDNYPIGQGKIKLSVAIFQHSTGDPINNILNKSETKLPEVYSKISAFLAKQTDLIKAGNEHKTCQVYQDLVNEIDNKNQAE